jgi:putative RNA 2'-phosphotransferase
MTEPSLIERITRSLAFMLRHQPEQFDLELDSQGWADVGEVVRALNERLGEQVSEDDLRGAVTAGDRVRYEIRGDRIRALYGHSIPVEPGPPSKPPELLYVGIPAQDVERARRFGLRGGRRRFLHLALTENDAAEGGKRGSRDYTVLTVRALEAWEEGVNFFDRQSLWLAEEVPTHFLQVGETRHDGRESPHGERHEGGRDRGPFREHHRRGWHEDRERERGHGGDAAFAETDGGEAAVPAAEREPLREGGESRERYGAPGGHPHDEGGRRRRRGRGRGRGRGRDRDREGMAREPRESREPREPRASHEPRESRDSREPRESFARSSQGNEPVRDRDRGRGGWQDRDARREAPEPPRREPPPPMREAPSRPEPAAAQDSTPFGAGLFAQERAPERREPRPARRPEPPPRPPAAAEADDGGGGTPFGAGL